MKNPKHIKKLGTFKILWETFIHYYFLLKKQKASSNAGVFPSFLPQDGTQKAASGYKSLTGMVESYLCLQCIFLLCYVHCLFCTLEGKQFKKHFSVSSYCGAPTVDKHCSNFPEKPCILK